MSHHRLSPIGLLALAALCSWPALAPAQQPSPLSQPNPQAPVLNQPAPLGVQRGTTLDLTLTGTNLADPTALWLSFPAKVLFPSENNNGKDPAKLLVRLEVPKDAPLGFHSLRLATRRGLSNVRLFCIDDLPQVQETDTNRSKGSAQPITAPCIVVGRADAEASDFFRITAKAGQRLSFEVLGRRLGSAFDPQITLLDAGSGRELPGGFSNDAPGLQTDCRLSYVFKNAGDVIVAVRDVSYRGGADFHYRLRIGDFPCATTPLPLAVKRGSKTSVKFAGPYVEGVAAVEVQAPTEATVDSIQVAPKGTSGLHGWPVLLHLSNLDEALEKEPNDDPKQANRIEVPGAITGRFEQKDDTDCYVFKAQKGKRYAIEAHTAEHHSPSEVYVAIKNDKGAQVIATNPMAAPKLDFTAPADGDYTIVVEHLHAWGGPDEVYRLTVTPYAPGFGMTLNLDRWDVPPGGTFSVPIFVQQAGYAGAIEVSVVGPKGLSGTLTIPAGARQPAAPAGTLVIKADDSLPTGPVSFAIQGKAKIDGKDVTVLASVRGLVSVGMGNLAVPPRHMFTQLGLAVTEKPPFSLALKFEAPSVAPGAAIECTISVTREKDFTADVVIALTGLPPGVKTEPAAVKIPGNQTAVKVKLTAPANAKLMPYQVTVTGTAKHNGRDWTARAGPVQMLVKK
jgi:hypothetical protein